jgi:hypothetical protein
MARAACKFIVHFSMSFCTTRLFLLSEHPYAHGRASGTLYYDGLWQLSSFWRVVWLMSSSRVDSAMRGSSISFLTRASVAWLDSCLGSFLCMLARCHKSKGITGQFGTQLLAVSELSSYRTVRPCAVKGDTHALPTESWRRTARSLAGRYCSVQPPKTA